MNTALDVCQGALIYFSLLEFLSSEDNVHGSLAFVCTWNERVKSWQKTTSTKKPSILTRRRALWLGKHVRNLKPTMFKAFQIPRPFSLPWIRAPWTQISPWPTCNLMKPTRLPAQMLQLQTKAKKFRGSFEIQQRETRYVRIYTALHDCQCEANWKPVIDFTGSATRRDTDQNRQIHRLHITICVDKDIPATLQYFR